MIPADLSSWATWTPLANHVWQSTFFVGVIWLVTLTLKSNRAAVRYWLWFAASAKFLVPFSLLVALGSKLDWRMAPTLAQLQWSSVVGNIAQPFVATAPVVQTVAPHASFPLPAILLCVWLSGVTVGIVFWLRCWWQMRNVRRKATPLALGLPIPVLSSPSQIEPGVFGIFRPVLLLPEGITARLTPAQLDAVIAHEMCHLRRRDNLTAAIHMLVETIFWFFPVVYWLRSRLLEERERSCDEEVLWLGGEPEQYAQGIIEVCKSYVRSPVACVSGILGSELRRRIIRIAARQTGAKLTLFRKLILCAMGVAIVAAPTAFGLLNAHAGPAQSQQSAKAQLQVGGAVPAPAFDVVSIKPNPDGGFIRTTWPSRGEYRSTAQTPQVLILEAYGVQPYQISGAPDWFKSAAYDIDAKVDEPIAAKLQKLDPHQLKPAQQHMLQALLTDRFKLKIHWQNRQIPVYGLIQVKAGKTGPQLKPHSDAPPCPDLSDEAQHPPTPSQILSACGGMNSRYSPPGPEHLWSRNTTMQEFVDGLQSMGNLGLDRSLVDRTGLMGRFDFSLDFVPEPPPGGWGRMDMVPPDASGPTFIEALRDQLGLKLEPTTGLVPFVVIDHVEQPSPN